jgi:Tfp pilus assembly protein PilE
MNKFFYKKYYNEKGISLVELVVSVSVFSLVVIASSGIFMNAIKTQKVILAKQNVAENMRYTSEFMVKELRMAQVNAALNMTFQKTPAEQLDFDNSPSETIIFTNYNGDVISYSLSGNKIMRNSGSGAEPVSSDEVEVTGLSFILNNWNLTLGPAPLITIIIKAKSTSGVGGVMELQTSVAPRIYN